MARKKAQKISPSEAVDEQLARYRAMRDFSMTAEPSGGAQKKNDSELPFVIQKHAATRLHYDFRLGWHGVLKSWAVAKGPSYYTGDKRLAVQVEDHPIEYGGFEGTIPQGEYGGGSVLLWDRGRWIPDDDPGEGLRKGRLGFTLEGEKLRGHWTLVAMRGLGDDGKKNWLLIKSRDGEARAASDYDVAAARPDSVAAPRRGPPRVWRTNKRRSTLTPTLSRRFAPGEGALPERFEPELATLVDAPPAGSEWLHEIKFDGYRILARLDAGRVTLYTRRFNDWTSSFPTLAEALGSLKTESAFLDGELVVLDAKGVPSFQELQNALGAGQTRRLVYYVFDAPFLDGEDLRGRPLRERKDR